MAYITNLIKNVSGTSLYIEDALQQGFLYEGVNNITQTNDDLPFIIDLDYVSQENPYLEKIYSQDDKNKIKIWFNNVELEDADRYVEKLTRIARILPNDGSKRFSLNNFISTSIELILHNVDLEDIQDQVTISIGTLVSANTYEYVPLGIFNIQDTPENDKGKIILKLRDNRVKFDFGYNAQPLIEQYGGQVTKKQILDDICNKAGVTNTITTFAGDSDLVGIYDSTIKGSTYVAYLMEQAGLIATIDRQGRLAKIDLSDLYTWQIPLNIVESYEKGEPYSIERVVYETGITKYQTSSDETLNTLYLDSGNPYITSQTQVDNIYDLLKDFEIDSATTKRVLGNPAIDPYDLIEIVDDSNNVVFKTLANTTYTYTGVHRDTFDTQIGIEQRKENVSVNGEQAFRKYARTSIDNLNAEIDLISAETKIFSNETVGIGSITLESAYTGTLHRLEIIGNIEQLRIKSSLAISDDLYPKDTILTVDSTNEYYLDFQGADLYYDDEDNYLKYVYEEGKQWLEEKIDGVTQELEYSQEEIQIQVEETSTLAFNSYPTAMLKSIYLIKNDYTDTFTNIMDIVAQINLTPGNAVINANKIKLEGYTTINNGFGVDLEGNMFANNGSFKGNVYLENNNKVIGGDGILTNLQYNSFGIIDGWSPLGFNIDDQQNVLYQDAVLDYTIPDNFTIETAYLTLYTSRVMTSYMNTSTYQNIETTGSPKQLKLYKGFTNYTHSIFWGQGTSYFFRDDLYTSEEIENAFNTTSYTPNISSVGSVDEITTIDLTEYLSLDKGNNQLIVRTNITKPSDYTTTANRQAIAENTGMGRMVLNIIGYMKMEESE